MSTRYADDSGITHIFDILKATFVTKNNAPQPSTGTPLMDGVGNVGISRKFAREDHVHPSDTSKANITSPNLLGTPTAPTAAVGTASQQIANTQFVQNALTNSGFQQALTAGSHIRIENNVISAYSIGDVDDVQTNGNSIVSHGVANLTDFRGATVEQAGTAGLVPAPSNWENEKFLCADGTWKSVSGGGSGGGGVNYSKQDQDTGIRWIDGRAVHQITFDLSDYEPVSGMTGAKQYQIDVSDLDIGMVIDVEQVGYIYVGGAYIYTTLNGFYSDDYFVGVSSDRTILNVYQTEVSGGYKYFMNHITIRYINPVYIEYDWDFTQSLIDKNYNIPFVGTATRDSLGLHITTSTYATLWKQGVDWTPVGGTEPTNIPQYTKWSLELDIAEVDVSGIEPPPFGRFPSIATFCAGYYGYVGVSGVNEYWKFNPLSASEQGSTLSVSGESAFDGHTLKISRNYDHIKFYKDNVLFDTITLSNDGKFYMGNITSLGSVYIRGKNDTTTMGQSLPCTITGCRFKRFSVV